LGGGGGGEEEIQRERDVKMKDILLVLICMELGLLAAASSVSSIET
jgi:hypothetical protein